MGKAIGISEVICETWVGEKDDSHRYLKKEAKDGFHIIIKSNPVILNITLY